jgi:HK97 gp10 family phage protein
MDSEVITGLDALGAQLAELAPNIQKKLMRGALRAGLKVTLQRAKSEIHNVSGDLSKSLRITSARNGVVKATLKAGSKDAYYAHMVEFGTAAHMIAAKDGKSVSIGGQQYSKVEHPGASARPFMYPALDAAAQNESEVFQAVGAYMGNKINENLPRLPDETDSKS